MQKTHANSLETISHSLKDFPEICHELGNSFSHDIAKLQQLYLSSHYQRASLEEKEALAWDRFKELRKETKEAILKKLKEKHTLLSLIERFCKRFVGSFFQMSTILGGGLLLFIICNLLDRGFFYIYERGIKNWIPKLPTRQMDPLSFLVIPREESIFYAVLQQVQRTISREPILATSSNAFDFFKVVLIGVLANSLIAFGTMLLLQLVWQYRDILSDFEQYRTYKALLSIENIKDPLERDLEQYVKKHKYIHKRSQKAIDSFFKKSYIKLGAPEILKNFDPNALEEYLFGMFPEHYVDISPPSKELIRASVKNYNNAEELELGFCQIFLAPFVQQEMGKKKGLHPSESSTKCRNIILVHGDPGTGKTYTVGKLLEESGIHYITVDLSKNDLASTIRRLNHGGGPNVMFLDDGDRFLNSEEVTSDLLCLMDPNKEWLFDSKNRVWLQLPRSIIVVSNHQIADAATRDRFTLSIDMNQGFTKEGKEEITMKYLEAEIKKMQEVGYDISMEDITEADKQRIHKRIYESSEDNISMRPLLNWVKTFVAKKIIGYPEEPVALEEPTPSPEPTSLPSSYQALLAISMLGIGAATLFLYRRKRR